MLAVLTCGKEEPAQTVDVDKCRQSRNYAGPLFVTQVDTPTKKLILGIAVFYMALVIFVPTLNVFVQVRCSATLAEE